MEELQMTEVATVFGVSKRKEEDRELTEVRETLKLSNNLKYDILFKISGKLLKEDKLDTERLITSETTEYKNMCHNLNFTEDYDTCLFIILDKEKKFIDYRYYTKYKKYATVKNIQRHIAELIDALGTKFPERFRNSGKHKDTYDRNLIMLSRSEPSEFPN
jgi:hypothetical protein